MTSLTGIVYMSCEVGRRELGVRSFLAGILASAGIASIICHKTFFSRYSSFLPRGIFFHKSVTKVCQHHFARSKSHGHLNVGICEELLNHWSDNRDHGFESSIHFESLNFLDYFISSNFYDGVRVSQWYPEKVIPIGNLRLEYARSAARKVYQDLVLELSSAYPEATLYLSPGGPLFAVRSLSTELAHYNKLGHRMRPLEVIKSWMARDLTVIEELGILEDLPEQTPLVVRPHPHDDPEFFPNLFAGKKIVNGADYEIHPWALSASKVIHFDSTSFLEMYAMGTTNAVNLSKRLNRHILNERMLDLLAVQGIERFLFFNNDMACAYREFFSRLAASLGVLSAEDFRRRISKIAVHEETIHKDGWDDPSRFDQSMLSRWRVSGSRVDSFLERAMTSGFSTFSNGMTPAFKKLGPMAYVVSPEVF
jgi:surface carbohydrate biosynthesis protein